MLPISIQLYTVRDLTAKDFAGTINALTKIGYRAVELAGYGNLKSAREVRKVLDDAGMTISGAHAAIEALEDDLNKVLDETQILGNKNLICPWMPEARRKNADGWKQVAGSLSQVASRCEQRGITFSYHNHSFEFQKFDGQTGFDIFFETADQLVKSELDVYWARHGGQDPVALINRLGSRVLILHLKDMAPGPDQKFAPVGTGLLDFKSILTAAEKAGAKWGVVEQDSCYGMPPLEAVKISFENLKKMSNM